MVLDLTGLHLIDATGLTAFESALEELVRRNKKIIILGATVGVQKSIEKFIAEESVLKAIQWYQNIEQIP